MAYHDIHDGAFRTLDGIRQPRIARVAGWIIVFSIVIAGLVLWFVPWVQTAQGAGTVIALNPNDRQQEINALVSGRIMEWYVRDGSRVSVGDPIVRIVDNDPQLLERLQAERAQVVAKLGAAQAALETAEIDLRRTEELFEGGLAARRDFEQARIRVEERRSGVAEASAELQRVDVNLSRQSVQVVRAPRDGVIVRVLAGGDATFASAGQVVATFVPANVERAIELYVDGRDIALVRVGARVRLQFEGWPVVQFSGWPSVAVGTFGGIVTAVDPAANAAGRFRILVVEDPDDDHAWPDLDFVRFGSIARGWVLMETVPLGYEIWRQLNNFPPEFVQRAQG